MTNDERIKPEALEAEIAEMGKSVTDLAIYGKFHPGVRAGRVVVERESDDFTVYATSEDLRREVNQCMGSYSRGGRFNRWWLFRYTLGSPVGDNPLIMNTFISSIDDSVHNQSTLVVDVPTDHTDHRSRWSKMATLFFAMPKEKVTALLKLVESYPDVLDKFLKVAADGFVRLEPGKIIAGKARVTDQIALVDLEGLFQPLNGDIEKKLVTIPNIQVSNLSYVVKGKMTESLGGKTAPAVKWLTVPKAA